MMSILLVEDEELKRVAIGDFLTKRGYEVFSAADGLEGLQRFKEVRPDIVIADLRMPGMDGLQLLKEIKRTSPETAVVMVTAYATVETAVEAMKAGAYDYLTKPFGLDELLIVVKRIEEYQRLKTENIILRQRLQGVYSFHNLIGKSSRMVEVYRIIQIVADTQSTVLIYGESGTGKELVANAIHYNSGRREGPLVKVNCAVLTESLLESELFGHERGAFTGAIKRKVGRFELANRGTIFLDDVDDMPPSTQVKLLRVLQEREFERVGGTLPIQVDVRVLAATKKELQRRVEEGSFREDLFFRLNVIPILLPPLRDRKEDIELLVEHFLKKVCARANKRITGISPLVLDAFLTYPWPGNVRELENTIERMVTLSQGEQIDETLLPAEIRESASRPTLVDMAQVSQGKVSYNQVIEDIEKKLIKWALETGGNKTKAAELLGMKRTTFCDKAAKYGLGQGD